MSYTDKLSAKLQEGGVSEMSCKCSGKSPKKKKGSKKKPK